MADPVAASFSWTEGQLIRATENHLRARRPPVVRFARFVLAMTLILVGGWSFCAEWIWSLPIFGLLLGGLLLLKRYYLRWMLRRHFRSRRDQNTRVIWKLDDETIRIRTDASETRKGWSQIAKVRKARDGFLLYANDRVFQWIPFEAFASEEDRSRAEALLRSKVDDLADVR